MAIKEYNVDLDIKGRVLATTVPNSTGSIVTWNSTSKVFGLRTNSEILSDLGLTTVVNNSHAHSNKTILDSIINKNISQWTNDSGYLTSANVTGFIPYTGATTDVNLNNRQLTNVNHLQLNQQTTTSTFLQLPTNNTSVGYADDQTAYDLAPFGSLFYQRGNLMMKVENRLSGNSSVFSNGFLGVVNSPNNTEYTTNTLLMNLYGLGYDSKGILNQSYNFNDNLKYNNTSTALNIVGYQYGNKLLDVNNNSSGTTFVGFHPEMYEGMHIGATNNFYNSEIYVDIRGQIFARRNRTYQGGVSANWNMFYSDNNSNKTTIDWNANTLNANIIKKVGGTASQFLKADGSVDSNTYALASSVVTGFIPYTGATQDVDLNTKGLTIDGLFYRKSNTLQKTDLTPGETTTGFKRYDSPAALSITSSPINSDIVIKLPEIGSSTVSGWVAEVMLYAPPTTSGLPVPVKLTISARTVSAIDRSVSATGEVQSISEVRFGRIDNSPVLIIKKSGGTNNGYMRVELTKFYTTVYPMPAQDIKSNYSITLENEADIVGFTYIGTIINAQFTRDSYLWNKGDFTQTNVTNWNTAFGWGNHALAGYLTSTDLNGYATETWVTQQIGDINIPTVNDGQLTLSTGTGLSGSATFTANQSGSSTFSVAVASTHKLPTITEWNALPTTNTITRLRGTATGTYTSGDLTLLAGAGIGVTQSGANITITNSSPNIVQTLSQTGQVVTLSNGGGSFTLPTPNAGTVTSVAMTTPTGLTVTGSPITSNGTLALGYATGYQGYTTAEADKLAGLSNYVLPTASATVLGGVKVGANLSIDSNGVLSATNTNTTYTAGTGLSLTGTVFGQTITTSGTGSFVTGVTQTANGFQVNLGTPPNTTYSTGSLAELNTGTVTTGRVWGANVLNQWLNAKGFSTQTLTAGTNISIVGNVISATNTNTTYSAGAGLTLSGTTFSLPITVSGSGNYVTDVTQTTNGITVTKGTLPTSSDFITTNTTQTGLTGNKTTSGIFNFIGDNAAPVNIIRTTANNSSIGYGINGSVSAYAGLAGAGTFAIGDGGGTGNLNLIANTWFRVNNTGRTFVKSGYSIDGRTNNDMLLAGGGHRPVSDFALAGSLGDYLPLAGGTMNSGAVINWSGTQAFVQIGGISKLRFSSTITVLSSSVPQGDSYGIYLRPQGDTQSSGQVIIDGNGQINTSSHGNSSQWKQAYDWGDFRQFGLGTGGNAISDFDNQPVGSMGYTHSSTLNQPSGLGYGALFKFGSTSSFTQIFGAYTQSNRLFFRHYRNGTYYPLVELYHTGNLTTATATVDGLIKLGSNTVNTATAAAVSATASRTYLTQLNSSGQLVVNVPWSNTTYSAGTLALLQAGTNTTNRVWSAQILAQRFTEINRRIVYYRDSNENVDSDVQWGTNIITGRGTQVQGGRNIVNGDYINVFGNRNISSGMHNQINGFVNVANGVFNTINGFYSSISGSQANIIGNYLFARDKQTVLGMYNKVYDLGQDEGLRFAFGTGNNDFDKYNAVEIYEDHRTEFHGRATYQEKTRDPAWFTKDYTHVDTYQMGYDHLPHRASSSTSCEAGILRVAARVSSNFSSDDDRFTSLGDLKLTYNIHGIVDGNSIEDTINESRIHTKGTLEFSGPVTSILISNAKIDTNNLLIVRYNHEKNMMDMVGYVNSTMLTEFKSIPHIVTILLGSFILKQNEFGEPIAFFEFNQQIL